MPLEDIAIELICARTLLLEHKASVCNAGACEEVLKWIDRAIRCARTKSSVTSSALYVMLKNAWGYWEQMDIVEPCETLSVVANYLFLHATNAVIELTE